MKNPTILKGELSLLRADKSAVITELRKSSKQLKIDREDINKLEIKREGVKTQILEEMARLDDITGRAIFVRAEVKDLNQEFKNKKNQYDSFARKSTQEERLHLGRIQELTKKEEGVITEIGRLKSLFDKNSEVFNELESERRKTLRELDSEIGKAKDFLIEVETSLKEKTQSEKKITKDRLKREDKIRLREKNLDARELSVDTREEDLITMSKDMMIMYGRLKELYSKDKPGIDLDKLILQAL